MNRCTRRPLVASLCVLLIPPAAFGQEGPPESEQLSADAAVTDVTTGESVEINVAVSGGTGPYTVTITDLGPVEGGFLDRTTASGAGPNFAFLYTAPRDDVGSLDFDIQVTDSLDLEVTAGATLQVRCSIIGLCTEVLSNAELEDLNILDFEPELSDDEPGGPDPGTTGSRLVPANLAAARILNRLDIDEDDLPDNSDDTDRDGLPDNWELGGAEEEDRVVFYPAPSAIVPGTPPTPIFTRLAVATSALEADTDGDGLSDFVEVFGLKYIDENGNGLLDAGEWADFNSDGLPSPGEYPLDNATRDASGVPDNPFALLHDFDGFVFTDPTNPDTDGDGIADGEDNDPLINPRSFGNTSTVIVRFEAEGDPDIDKDGIGNGMDMGNDLVSTDGPGVLDFEAIDNPQNVSDLLRLFRADLLAEQIVPESSIEDLIGADWDGNGLWRTTDIRGWSIVIDPTNEATKPPDQFFLLDTEDPETPAFYTSQKLADLLEAFNEAGYNHYGGRGIGLGWQDLLRPPSTTQFIPDKRIWAILYAWRVPGFDIDGDGFIGAPNLSSTAPAAGTATVGANGDTRIASVGLVIDSAGMFTVLDSAVPVTDRDGQPNRNARPFDDRITIAGPEPGAPALDGFIEAEGLTRLFRGLGCGGVSVAMLMAMMLGLGLTRLGRRRV